MQELLAKERVWFNGKGKLLTREDMVVFCALHSIVKFEEKIELMDNYLSSYGFSRKPDHYYGAKDPTHIYYWDRGIDDTESIRERGDRDRREANNFNSNLCNFPFRVWMIELRDRTYKLIYSTNKKQLGNITFHFPSEVLKHAEKSRGYITGTKFNV
jgi:hypothetical protein